MSSHYLLVRDADESERLIKQHDLWIKSLGYRIHPSIEATLPKTQLRIADVGCGTGIWLIDLALRTHDTSSRFDGFDISSEQFPHQSKGSAAATAEALKEAKAAAQASKGTVTEGEDVSVLPGNVEMHVQDMRNPFPAEYHAKFDVVHVRLMLLSIDPHEWDKVVANLLALLKPGGWVQWEELDLTPFWSSLRSGPLPSEAGRTFLEKGMHYLIASTRHRAENVHNSLLNACRKAGLKDIQTDVVSSDRDPTLRPVATKLQTHVMKNVGRKRLQDGAKDAWSQEELDRVSKGMDTEVLQGAYVNYYIHCIIGRT